MPIVNRVAEFADDVKGWRHDLHAHPELLYEVHRTAAFVAEKLRAFGCDEVVTGIGRTGVVGVIRGRGKGAQSIALRADMDALPIIETPGAEYASTAAGKMHACGHDGHMAMLLGAARYLTETRNFSGTVIVVFQPAEEGGAGAKAMIDDGLVKRFGIERFFGMHNLPGLAAGEFAMRVGPIMAATDNFDIEIESVGGHAARPHLAVDPIVVGAQMVGALQAIVSRNVDPLEAAVVSVCHFEAGHTHNVIAPRALLQGTSRSLTESVRTILESRIRETVEGIARQHGTTIKLDYKRGYPVTINHADETHLAERIAADVAGKNRVHDTAPLMAGEDFAYMLLEKPGAFIFVGNGDTAGLHTPGYDFNDDVLPVGMSYWIKLVETALPA